MKDEEYVDFHTAIAKAKANLPLLVEMTEVMMKEHLIRARALKSYFDSLVEVGFTKEQALEIVKDHGWMGK